MDGAHNGLQRSRRCVKSGASAIRRFDASRRDLRTQIAPDVKSKYDSLSFARSLSPIRPFSAPADSIGAQRTSSRDLHPRIRRRARRRERPGKKAPRSPFNLRGIILRMPRLVALLDEEENKLYSQVFSRGSRVRRTPAERRAERTIDAHSTYFPVGFQISYPPPPPPPLPPPSPPSLVGPYKGVRCLLC